MFYVFTLLLVVGGLYDTRFGEGSFPFGAIAIACGLGIGFLSDWKMRHTWFGAREIDMSGKMRTRAKIVSSGLMLGSWLCFIGVGLAIY